MNRDEHCEYCSTVLPAGVGKKYGTAAWCSAECAELAILAIFAYHEHRPVCCKCRDRLIFTRDLVARPDGSRGFSCPTCMQIRDLKAYHDTVEICQET